MRKYLNLNNVKKLLSYMKEDVDAVKDRDPAAGSTLEVLLLYPGLHAVWYYRVAHVFQRHGHKFVARAISQYAAKVTGIEIHPGATIGRRLFIDHGHGVVIGETTEIGDDVTLYQGVTLGGTGKDVGKRHPTLGNGVMVGSGAKVLGPLTIGDNAKVASGAVLLKDIPKNSTAVGVPAHVVRLNGEVVTTDAKDLDQIHIPDPVNMLISGLLQQVESLSEELSETRDLERKNQQLLEASEDKKAQ